MPLTRLAERVNAVVAGTDHMFSPEVLNAMRLADVYGEIEPKVDVLPLDAMAGFPMRAVVSPSDTDDEDEGSSDRSL